MTAEEKIAQAAFVAAEAREALHTAIRKGRAAGLPLRTIATAANLSPEWVRRIAAR